MGPGLIGYAGIGTLGDLDVMTGLKRFDLQQQNDVTNAQNSTWATLSFLVGAVAVTGVWYFYFRPKAHR